MQITKQRLIEIIKEEMPQAEAVEDVALLGENDALANAFELYHKRHVKPIFDAANVMAAEHRTLMGKIEKLMSRIDRLEKALKVKPSPREEDGYGDTDYADLPDRVDRK